MMDAVTTQFCGKTVRYRPGKDPAFEWMNERALDWEPVEEDLIPALRMRFAAELSNHGRVLSYMHGPEQWQT